MDGTNICVISFTQDGDLLSQWRGYGGRSSGCSIGFDGGDLLNLGKAQGFSIRRCIYEEQKQVELIRDYFDEWTARYPGPEINSTLKK
jgi:hypothetical protein